MANGVIETATGDLLRWGFGDFATDGAFNSETETIRTDAPEPSKARGQHGEAQMHRWNGSAWTLVAQPATFDENTARYHAAVDAAITVTLDAEALTWRFMKRSADRSIDIRGSISAGSFGVRLNGDTADRVTLTPSSPGRVIDISAEAEGLHTIHVYGRSASNTLGFLEVHNSR
jgi:hypothetical protein